MKASEVARNRAIVESDAKSSAGISPGQNDYCTFADKGYMHEIKEAMKDPTYEPPKYSIYYAQNFLKAGENSLLDKQGKDSIDIVPTNFLHKCFCRLFDSLISICCCRVGAQDNER